MVFAQSSLVESSLVESSTVGPNPVGCSSDRSRTITYSPAYTLVPTYECFNQCTYCNFRVNPGHSPWMTVAKAEARLRLLQTRGILEILILSGEVHPKHPQRAAWVQRIYDLCDLALSLGFLPHTNAGPLSFDEMVQLKRVNVSMGLMLEQITPKLQTTVHHHAPSKDPALRLQQLAQAGRLHIPFTTGLLLGIGETSADQRQTLEAIATLHRQWGHIQEVILQPHSPGQTQTFGGEGFSPQQLLEVVATARQILPQDIAIQIPPNLVERPTVLINCIEAGARDLGGIGPLDEVNPGYPHQSERQLATLLQAAGWNLVPRLAVYPQYEAGLSPRLRSAVQQKRAILNTVLQNSSFQGLCSTFFE